MNLSILITRGAFPCSAPVTTSAIFPISVLLPVAITTPLALPVITVEPAKAKFFRSPISRSSSSRFALFSTVVDSPVRNDSSQERLFVSINLMSADSLSPDSARMMSPGTNSFEFTVLVSPLRITLDSSFMMFSRASALFSALYSWVVPIIAFKATTAIIKIASSG